MELGKFIETYGNNAVPTLRECCKVHKSACLDSYSSPNNQTLLYTAIKVRAYEVVKFLFSWSENYKKHVDDFGITKDYYQENKYVRFKTVTGDNTKLTPLMLACSKGYVEGAMLLIENGAIVSKMNYQNGNTYKNALDYAIDFATTIKATDKNGTDKAKKFLEYLQKIQKEQEELMALPE